MHRFEARYATLRELSSATGDNASDSMLETSAKSVAILVVPEA
jgi:hypothetical protein